MLSESEEIELLDLLEAQYGGEGLDDFIRRVMPQWPPPAHVAPLRTLWERTRHDEVRAVVSLPRRHVKTETNKPGTAWRLFRDPACLNAFIGYNDTFASGKSKEIRDLAIKAGVALRDDSTAANLWRTRNGGGLLAAGIGGALTGFGITGVMLVDDPFKNAEEAESQVIRDKAWEWFTRVAYPAVEPGGSIIVCATRWHHDDLIGRIKTGQLGEKWETIELAAVLDEHGQPADERLQPNARALWPEVYPLERLAKTRATLGEHGWWAMYQQQPRPRGGQLFRELKPEERFDLDKLYTPGMRFVVGVDPAATEHTKGDFSAVVTLGIDWQGLVYVLDVQRWQVQIPDLVRRLRHLGSICKHAQGAPLVIEAIGGFKAVPQMLSQMEPALQITEVQPVKDKFLRAQPLSAAWNQGKVRVPVSAPWLGDFLREVMTFTGSEDVHDDQVDAFVHAFDYLAGHTANLDDWPNQKGTPRAFTSSRGSAWDDD